MGEVYRARDPRLRREVALKVLPADHSADPERRRRLLREARAASGLSHPNILTVHAIVSEDGLDCIVMELVDGETLRQKLAAGGVDRGPALRWGAQIADALCAAHEAGIIHRDLKPENVMIDRRDRVRVLDFGLARCDSRSDRSPATAPPSLTAPGTVLGTVSYMSPEQALGQRVDARSDIFSLGSVLYELLTGCRPFAGDSAASILHAVAYSEARRPRELRPELPPPVEAVILRSLEKRVEDRFQSMEDLAGALRRVAEGARMPADRTLATRLGASLAELRQTGAKRAATVVTHPLRGAVAAAVVLAIAAAALFLAGGGFQTVAERLAAPGRAAEVELPLTPYDMYQQGLGFLEHFYRTGYLAKAIDLLERSLEGDPDQAPAHAALALAYWRNYRDLRDPEWLKRAFGQAEHALSLDGTSVRARVALGLVALERGELEDARVSFEEALAMHPADAQARRGLGNYHRKAGDPAAAEREFRLAIEHEPADPGIHGSLGSLYYSQARYEEAAAAFARSTEVAPDYVPSYRNLAASYHMLGRYAEAAAALQKAVEIRPDPATYSNLGTLYFFQGLYPQAVTAFEQAVDLAPNSFEHWRNLGDAYRWTPGRRGEAAGAYGRAVELLGERLERTRDDPELNSRLALLQAKRGELEAARGLLAWLGGQPGLDAGTLYRTAVAYELTGLREQAVDSLRQAIAAGYSRQEIRRDPELTALRNDRAYHLMLIAMPEAEAAS